MVVTKVCLNMQATTHYVKLCHFVSNYMTVVNICHYMAGSLSHSNNVCHVVTLNTNSNMSVLSVGSHTHAPSMTTYSGGRDTKVLILILNTDFC